MRFHQLKNYHKVNCVHVAAEGTPAEMKHEMKHRLHQRVSELTAVVLLLWASRLGLHAKALSHDPAPEGPLSVPHTETCAPTPPHPTPPPSDESAVAPAVLFLSQSPVSFIAEISRSSAFASWTLLLCLSFRSVPRPSLSQSP